MFNKLILYYLCKCTIMFFHIILLTGTFFLITNKGRTQSYFKNSTDYLERVIDITI